MKHHLFGENFSALTSSQIRETTTSGDERAIPSEYLNAEQEAVEEEDDMTERLIQQLYADIVNYYFGG